MKYTLPQLPYQYNALEPYIDAKTMEIHHTRHHQAYIDKLNTALERYPNLQEMPVEQLVTNIQTLQLDDKDRVIIQNNGGGHLNHSFFWDIMSPEKSIDEALVLDINKTFGSVEDFKKKFTETAMSRFGSGWAWLVREGGSTLKIYSTANQDSPLTLGDTPIIGLDVWEHAYYIQYKWERAKYIENWWHVLKLLP